MNKEKSKQTHTISPSGSLGVLAYGDIAFRKWRQIKIESGQTELLNEEE
ncbi:hypothetical protein [Marinirhabdus gelatinilytica]|uniref:Uncharacterized protein n=1 Tax=Marinirhabdus gelatinilytica TaxID=1703343 RepID=A0A370Q7B6_9FLAO|nr:hypothetical protein [Marinirhabdus gelatinilytica]RDK84237.1 hypothetical protein C8D94_10582 [Marinirhabdus gelatinilytica]